MGPRLSENKVGWDYTGTRSSDNSDFIDCNSVAAVAMTQYSASVEDQYVAF